MDTGDIDGCRNTRIGPPRVLCGQLQRIIGHGVESSLKKARNLWRWSHSDPLPDEFKEKVGATLCVCVCMSSGDENYFRRKIVAGVRFRRKIAIDKPLQNQLQTATRCYSSIQQRSETPQNRLQNQLQNRYEPLRTATNRYETATNRYKVLQNLKHGERESATNEVTTTIISRSGRISTKNCGRRSNTSDLLCVCISSRDENSRGVPLPRANKMWRTVMGSFPTI